MPRTNDNTEIPDSIERRNGAHAKTGGRGLKRMGWAILAFSLALSVSCSASGQEQQKARFESAGSRVVSALNAKDADALARDFNAGMRKAVPPEEVRRVVDEVTVVGRILALGEPSWPAPDTAGYTLTAERGTVELVLALDAENRIARLLIRPHASVVPSRSSISLRLPFRGRWLVGWGGPTAAQNAHHDELNQRFALDLVAVGPGGEDARGDKTRNEDYLAYGQEILAPAEGVVTDVIDGVRDNRRGSMNPYSVVGNAVILRLAEKEYAVFAHLKPGSIRVRPGDRVVAGQVLALCGNSGNSSQPHLHFHLQQTPVLQDGIGIEPVFESVERERDGKRERVSNYSPVKGDVLSALVPE